MDEDDLDSDGEQGPDVDFPWETRAAFTVPLERKNAPIALHTLLRNNI